MADRLKVALRTASRVDLPVQYQLQRKGTGPVMYSTQQRAVRRLYNCEYTYKTEVSTLRTGSSLADFENVSCPVVRGIQRSPCGRELTAASDQLRTRELQSFCHW